MRPKGADPSPSLMQLFLRMGGWVVIVLGGVLVILSLAGQSSLNTAERFEAEGRKATALVVDKYTRESRDPDGDVDINHHLSLQFTTQAGEAIAIEPRVNYTYFNRAAIGEKIRLTYLETAPARIELEAGDFRRGAGVLQTLALFCGLVWLALLWLVGGWAVAAVRARRYGRLDHVQVVQVVPSKITLNGRPRYRLEWRDATGRTGRSLLHEAHDLDGYSANERITVYHGLHRMWWSGDVGFRPEHRPDHV